MAANPQVIVGQDVTPTPGVATLTLVLEPEDISEGAEALRQSAPAIGSPNGPGPIPPHAARPTRSANLKVMQPPAPPEPRASLEEDHPPLIRFDTMVIVAAIPLLVPAICVLCGVSILCCTIAEAWLVLGYILVFAVILLNRKQITRRDFAGFWTAILKTFSRHASATSR